MLGIDNFFFLKNKKRNKTTTTKKWVELPDFYQLLTQQQKKLMEIFFWNIGSRDVICAVLWVFECMPRFITLEIIYIYICYFKINVVFLTFHACNQLIRFFFNWVKTFFISGLIAKSMVISNRIINFFCCCCVGYSFYN